MYDYQKNKSQFDFGRLLKAMKNKILVALKLSLRRFNRLPLYRRVIGFLLFFVSNFAILMLILDVAFNVARSSSFLQSHKCPACYGFKACDKLQNGEITLTSASNLFGIIDSNLIKYYGKTSDGKEVVLTKLGNQKQLREWEKLICSKVITVDLSY